MLKKLVTLLALCGWHVVAAASVEISVIGYPSAGTFQDYEGAEGQLIMQRDSGDWRPIDGASRPLCEAAYPGQDSTHFMHIGLDRQSGTANFTTGTADSGNDLVVVDGEGNHVDDFILCSTYPYSGSTFLDLFVTLLEDARSEPTETATLAYFDQASTSRVALGQLRFEIRNLDPGVEPSVLPYGPEVQAQVVAGGESYGLGGPALTAYLAGRIDPIGLDDENRPYFRNQSSSAIQRIEHDGTLQTFIELSGYGFDYTGSFHIANEKLYFKQFERFYEVDLQSRAVSFLATFEPPPEHDSNAFCSGEFKVDSKGEVYHMYRARLYRISPATGVTTHIAGNGWQSSEVVDDIPATEAKIGCNAAFAIDPRDDSVSFLFGGTQTAIARINPDNQRLQTTDLGELHGHTRNGRLEFDRDGNAYFSLASYWFERSGYLYRYSERGGLVRVAGNGVQETVDDEGVSPLETGVDIADFALATNGDIYLSSAPQDNSVPNRIRRIDAVHGVIATVAGKHGFLGCASPTSTRMERVDSLVRGPNGVIYTESANAIVAIDPFMETVYTVAGLFSVRGDTPDGASAFGSPLAPIEAPNLAVGEDGAVYIAEQDRIRRVAPEDGELDTLVEGAFRALQFHAPSGMLYAIRNTGNPWSDLVRISTASGAVETVVPGGSRVPAIGEPAAGTRLATDWDTVDGYDVYYGEPRNFAVDSGGNIYLAVSDRLEPEFPSGVYRIDSGSGRLSRVLNDDYYGRLVIYGQVALDEENNDLYYSGAEQWFLNRRHDLETVRVDLSSGEQSRLPVDRDPTAMTYIPGFGLMTAQPPGWREQGAEILLYSNRAYGNGSQLPGDIGAGANAGTAVAESGQWIAVGVPSSDAANSGSGEVLLYRNNDCRPILQQRLSGPEGTNAQSFGEALVFAGEQLVVAGGSAAAASIQSAASQAEKGDFILGVFAEDQKSNRWQMVRDLSDYLSAGTDDIDLVSEGDSFAVGLPGGNGGSGEVKVFRNGADPDPQVITPTNPRASRFGRSVGMAAGRLAIGEAAGTSSAVEVFENREGAYRVLDVKESPRSDDRFAEAVALDDQSLYVGAPHHDGGRVYGFALGQDGLELSDTLADPSDPSNPGFGEALAIEDGVLVVGAPSRPGAASQVEMAGADRPKTEGSNGAIHVFEVRDKQNRRQQGVELFSLWSDLAGSFGRAVTVDNGRIVVGAPESNDGAGSFQAVEEIPDAARLSGLWYDPSLNGEGFNVIVSNAGMVVFFYGYTRQGERLWLISETATGPLRFGEEIQLPVYKALSGEFAAPVDSGTALLRYGVLTVSFGSLRSATFTINGLDGNKISRTTFLAGTEANAGAYAGLWYDAGKEGEGYNVISSRNATTVFYFGSNRQGERLWLISGNLPSDIRDGDELRGDLFEVENGDFFNPSSELVRWGTIEARFDDCAAGRIIMRGDDGNKTSDVVKLAGIAGAPCR